MPGDCEIARQRAESLRMAWHILQMLRRIVEASRGEALPLAKERSITEEGTIIAKHLAKHLSDLHRDRLKGQQATQRMWDYHSGKDKSVGVHSLRGEMSRMETKTENEIMDLAHLWHKIADEITASTGRVLYRTPTAAEIDRMLWQKRPEIHRRDKR